MKKSAFLKLFTVVLSALLVLAACSSGGEKIQAEKNQTKKMLN